MTVTSKGAAFEPGTAQACARAVNRNENRAIVDTKHWCRADGVELAG
ncbi:MAG: hypothetical protein ACRDKS_03595 [Actinomycetota bacterium]